MDFVQTKSKERKVFKKLFLERKQAGTTLTLAFERKRSVLMEKLKL